MNGTYELSKRLTVKKNYDVIVAGGGVAGAAAAISAAKNGLSTLLVEKSCMLGGLATLGLINLFVPMCNGRGKQIIFGLCEKWARLSATLGYDTIPEEWKDGEPKEPTDVRYIQRYSASIFALQLTEEVVSAGVDLLFDCSAMEPVMEGNECRGLVTFSKSGIELYGCRMLVDTTGDLDVMRHGGVPYNKRGNFFTYITQALNLDSIRRAVEKGDVRFIFSNITGGGINLFGDNQPSDVPMWTGLTVEEVSDYLIKNQRLIVEKLEATKEKRKEREIVTLPGMPQFRTTACLAGDYTFSVKDAYRHFDDSICAINDFEHRDHLFEVPYRSLIRRDYPNMITAGRSVSSTDYGWDLVRVIPPAILTGQAAGEAATIALRDGCNIADVNIRALQDKLEKENVMIHFPDEYVPEDRTVIIHGKNMSEINGGHL